MREAVVVDELYKAVHKHPYLVPVRKDEKGLICEDQYGDLFVVSVAALPRKKDT